MKHLSLGILAHVDAGKTTLSEAMLVSTGMIKEGGRVDKGDAFLDTEEMEKKRGITIFSKQAIIEYGDMVITLLDTPGHVDFSAEMERTLSVMDAAVLVINGSDGVQSHTLTLWKLLSRYNVPTFIFVNKMDLDGADKQKLIKDLARRLSTACVDFDEFISEEDSSDFVASSNEGEINKTISGPMHFCEEIAVLDEDLMERYLGDGYIEYKDIAGLIKQRKLFPCIFGSAIDGTGVSNLLKVIGSFKDEMVLKDEKNEESFGARVFKVSRDSKGERLTYVKITSGNLLVRSEIAYKKDDEEYKEKVNQIRIYSGADYFQNERACAGQVCALTGLSATYPGQGLGVEKDAMLPVLEPLLSYKVILPEEVDTLVMYPKLMELSQEIPELSVSYEQENKELKVKLMGEVQIDVIRQMIDERYGVLVSFGDGEIIYKETIADSVYGVGHYEPLKHYAEVHLLMEPAERGSGITADMRCSEDILDRNWQRLVVTHIKEKKHRGVLVGAELTDVLITVVSGRAHIKHTEGGDFRQATYRAIRQGLMQARSVLLEPYYSFTIEVPTEYMGKVIRDMEMMSGTVKSPEIDGDIAIIKGVCPVITMRDYGITLNSFTKGHGMMQCSFGGYFECHNTEEVMEKVGYNPDSDVDNPSSSVFCSHGAGMLVPWNEVPEMMHMPKAVEEESESDEETPGIKRPVISNYKMPEFIDVDEVDSIISGTSFANASKGKNAWKNKSRKQSEMYDRVKTSAKPKNVLKDDYLIVDGYNMIYAWDELKILTKDNMHGARGKLLDMIHNYMGYTGIKVMVVFDAYKRMLNQGHTEDYNGITVVYTKEDETADSYIERITHELRGKYNITVATSDNYEQQIVRGHDCMILSARELRERVIKNENDT